MVYKYTIYINTIFIKNLVRILMLVIINHPLPITTTTTTTTTS